MHFRAALAVLIAAAALAAIPSAVDAASASVNIVAFAFNPQTVTVNVGDAVVWTNQDNVAHSSTADGGTWDTQAFTTGQRTVIMATAGNFAYHCKIHPFMTGTVVVVGQAPSPPPTPARTPTPVPTAPPPTPAPTAPPSTPAPPTTAPTLPPTPAATPPPSTSPPTPAPASPTPAASAPPTSTAITSPSPSAAVAAAAAQPPGPSAAPSAAVLSGTTDSQALLPALFGAVILIVLAVLVLAARTRPAAPGVKRRP